MDISRVYMYMLVVVLYTCLVIPASFASEDVATIEKIEMYDIIDHYPRTDDPIVYDDLSEAIVFDVSGKKVKLEVTYHNRDNSTNTIILKLPKDISTSPKTRRIPSGSGEIEFEFDLPDDVTNDDVTKLEMSVDNLNIEVRRKENEPQLHHAHIENITFDDWGLAWAVDVEDESYFVGYESGHLFNESKEKELNNTDEFYRIVNNNNNERFFVIKGELVGQPKNTGILCTSPLPLVESIDRPYLAKGYQLYIEDIDTESEKVIVILKNMTDNMCVDAAVIDISEDATLKDRTYAYTSDLGDTKDIVIIAVHFKTAFKSEEREIVVVDGVWQVSEVASDLDEPELSHLWCK